MDLSGRVQLVKEGDSFSSGRHSFTFLMAPMVHWPEVMMTYDTTAKTLFTADAFGSFGALNGRLFADEVDFFSECVDEARRYYTNIVGKYGPQVQAILKKCAKLEISYVCPLHGFVWRGGFNDFTEKYLQWSSYTPEEKSVMIAYASVYGHTENAANILAAKLCEKGVKVRMHDTSVTPASYIVSDAFRCSHLVFAATTYNAGVFVTMENLLHDLAAHNLQNRTVAVIENGSWAPTSGKLMRELLAPCKNLTYIAENVTLKSALAPGQEAQLEALAQAFADELNPAPAPVETAAPAVPVPGEYNAELVNTKAFNKLSYGVEVLTTAVDGKDYGCIINSASQAASGDPKKVTISVISRNYTCDMIRKSGRFNVSILTEEAPYSLFQRFGFQSGREADKFADLSWTERTGNGIRYIPEYTNAVLSCEVTEVLEVGPSTLFVANVVEAKVLSSAPSATYSYYHAHIKPKKNPAPEQKECWVCKVCGYVYEGAELPDDFVCPLCKHGKEDFEHVVPESKKKQKGWVCKICGHFEPCEGELPADYACPLCRHGREDFEPAEQ
jgi:flavorubredoxin/flavin reductase (DIM6/NTAB) family NADH-FMN oxidoreductase RutF